MKIDVLTRYTHRSILTSRCMYWSKPSADGCAKTRPRRRSHAATSLIVDAAITSASAWTM